MKLQYGIRNINPLQKLEKKQPERQHRRTENALQPHILEKLCPKPVCTTTYPLAVSPCECPWGKGSPLPLSIGFIYAWLWGYCHRTAFSHILTHKGTRHPDEGTQFVLVREQQAAWPLQSLEKVSRNVDHRHGAKEGAQIYRQWAWYQFFLSHWGASSFGSSRAPCECTSCANHTQYSP